MTKAQANTAGESISRRVADELHERIDQAAEKGEQFENTLHKGGAQAQQRTKEMTSSFNQLARDNPWALVGGSLALGILIGALVGRR